ncbi:hypothetical protein LTR05_005826 [Lithohypha guttulata]|uniref:Uncharacterized protein n=1 Tax=Lithohypha guttulata TaxID=1690604 RepID=A0AAN7YGD5_9EURO|nr:hypothetical protein LTR05_005826 [Lithohypha guttulata]
MAGATPCPDGHKSEPQSDLPTVSVYELPTEPGWSGSYSRLPKTKYVVNGVTYDDGKPRLFIGNGRPGPDPQTPQPTSWPIHQDKNQSLTETEAQNNAEQFGRAEERFPRSGSNFGRHYHGIHLTGSGFTHLGNTIGMGQSSGKNTYSDVYISGDHHAMLGNVFTDSLPVINSQHTKPMACGSQESQQRSWEGTERHSPPYGALINPRDQAQITANQAAVAGDGTAMRSGRNRAGQALGEEPRAMLHKRDDRERGKAQDYGTISWLKRHGCGVP